MLKFFITRTNDLLQDGQMIDRFTSEAAAANMAIRFAQDCGLNYSIIYEAG